MTITLPFPPATGNHTTRINHKTGRFYTQPKVKQYRLAVRCEVIKTNCVGHTVVGWCKPLRVTVTITPPDRRRRDSGNLIKVVYDALTRAGFWADDSLVRDERIVWADPTKPGFITLEVTPL